MQTKIIKLKLDKGSNLIDNFIELAIFNIREVLFNQSGGYTSE